MEPFTASMQHSEQSIRQLSKVQYNTFQLGWKIMQAVCALLLIWLGLSHAVGIWQGICVFTGCWLFINMDTPAKLRADKVIDSMKGRFPFTRYSFTLSGIQMEASGEITGISYSALIRLVEDDRYFYLYISKLSAYMIDKKTAQPDPNHVRKRIENGSGLRFTRVTTLLNFNLRTLFANRRKSR